MLGKGVDIMELSMNTADAGDAGFSLVTLPEHVRCAYRIGRQAGRLMAALGLAQGVLTMKDALGTGAQKPVIWQHLQRLLVLADGAVLPLDLAALYRLQVQGQLLAKNGRLIAPRAELRAAVEQVFRV